MVGSGITLYKRAHPKFAPELLVERRKDDPSTPVQPPCDQKPQVKRMNVNQATPAELELLPGLGPALSRRIVEYREANGPFHSIEDLTRVSGIGPKTLGRIKDFICVEQETVGRQR